MRRRAGCLVLTDIAADTAIEAIKTGDTSAGFLKRYDQRIKADPMIQWTITCQGRWDLRKAQDSHDRKELKARVDHQFGTGLLTHLATPLTRSILEQLIKDPNVITKWVKMFMRYYYNWENEGREIQPGQGKKKGPLEQFWCFPMLWANCSAP